MAMMDDVIAQQMRRYPGGPVPSLPPPIEIARRGHRRHGGQAVDAPPGEGFTAGPPESAAAPRESEMNDAQRLIYDILYRPSNYLLGGKQGPQVAASIGGILPMALALVLGTYLTLNKTSHPFDPKEFGIPELEGLERDPVTGQARPIYKRRLPTQQAPGRTVPLGPGRTTGELEFEPFLHPWEEEEEEPPGGGGWKH